MGRRGENERDLRRHTVGPMGEETSDNHHDRNVLAPVTNPFTNPKIL